MVPHLAPFTEDSPMGCQTRGLPRPHPRGGTGTARRGVPRSRTVAIGVPRRGTPQYLGAPKQPVLPSSKEVTIERGDRGQGGRGKLKANRINSTKSTFDKCNKINVRVVVQPNQHNLYIKPNFDCNYTSPDWFDTKQNSFCCQINRKNATAFKIGLNYQDTEIGFSVHHVMG